MRTGLIAAMLLVVLSNASGAERVSGWRGDGTGVYSDQNPPTHWSQEENVVWAVTMPDRSNAQPVIAGDKVFVCAEPFELICMRVSDGEILWQRSNSYSDVTSPEAWPAVEQELSLGRAIRDRQQPIQDKVKQLLQRQRATPNDSGLAKEIEQAEQQIAAFDAELKELPLAKKYTLPITQRQYNGFTTATPTTNGQHVWAVFGNRVVVCYDIDGTLQWSAVLPDLPQVMWGHSSSPLLVDDKLIVCIDAIVALDAKTGYQVWRTKYGQSWGSPVSARIGNESVIFVANGRMLRASDGKQVAREGAPLERASPVVYNNTLYYVGLGGSAYSFPTNVGETLELTERWTADTKGGLVTASPVVFDGLVYSVSSKQHILNVLDASNGKTVYVKRLALGREPTWPSLCVAGGHLYVTNRDGTTLVLATGRSYQKIAENKLEYVISSPVFHNDRMFVRTKGHLYCIGASR